MIDTKTSLKEILLSRKSIRHYSAEPISKEIQYQLLEAARWTPSSRNAQPWQFVVADKYDNTTLHDKIAETLMDSNRMWASEAPLLIVSLAEKHFPNGMPNDHAWHDTGMANFAITLQAFDYDLYTHMLGGYKKDELKEALNIPLHLDPVAILAIGYEGEVEQLPEFLQERANSPRSRKPLESIVRTEEFL